MIEALGEESLKERERCFLIVGALDKTYDPVSQNICLNAQEKFNLGTIRDVFLLEEQREETRKREDEGKIVKNEIACQVTNLRKCRTFNCNRNFSSAKNVMLRG